MGDDNVDPKPDEFRGDLNGAAILPVRVTPLDRNVLAHYIAQIAQTAFECLRKRVWGRFGNQDADLRQFFDCLGECSTGRAKRNRGQQHKDVPPSHSTTSLTQEFPVFWTLRFH
jgi:hypothetical protein